MAQTTEKIFEVDESSDLPIWAQLRNRISYLIRTGHFKPGEQLPSVRGLAAETMINYNTVTKAYRDLENNGLVDNVRGRGMFVSPDIASGADEDIELTDSLLRDCIRRYRAFGMRHDDISERMTAISKEIELETESLAKRKKEHLHV